MACTHTHIFALCTSKKKKKKKNLNFAITTDHCESRLNIHLQVAFQTFTCMPILLSKIQRPWHRCKHGYCVTDQRLHMMYTVRKPLVATGLVALTCSPILLLSNEQRPWHKDAYHRPIATQNAHNQEAFATGQLLHRHMQNTNSLTAATSLVEFHD